MVGDHFNKRVCAGAQHEVPEFLLRWWNNGVNTMRVPPQRDTGSAVATAAEVAPQHAITLTDNALSHLRKLQKEAGSESLLLRVGVKQGGCSGMSYVMDFETDANIKEDDYIVEYEGGFRLACDPKSLLYLFGMSLDYSDALIGGGFNFSNPNAESSCGCGKSFSV